MSNIGLYSNGSSVIKIIHYCSKLVHGLCLVVCQNAAVCVNSVVITGYLLYMYS
jgi:hypothetical protein